MAQADIDSLQKEERAWPTAGKQFKLSRTSAQERMTFFLSFGERRKLLYFINNGVSILYVCYVLYLQIWNPQPVLMRILYVYTYIDTYRYVLYEQWCMYLVHVVRTNMYNTEYVLKCTYKDTYEYVFMCNGVRILCVLYIHTG